MTWIEVTDVSYSTLNSDPVFEVLQIEVWGCGGNAAEEAQATARKRNGTL